MIAKFLLFCSYSLFILSGVMSYAYVYDVEPFTQEKHYQLERDAYSRSNDAAYNDFPSFTEWCSQEADREQRMYEWACAVAQQIGVEVAEICEWRSVPDCSQPMSAEQWRIQYGD